MAGASVSLMRNNTFLSNHSNAVQRITNVRPHFQHTCFIIPEYMNKKIVEKGTKEQKERAWKNVLLTEQLRGRRQVTGLLTSMLSVSDKLHRTIYDAQKEESLPGKLMRLEGGKAKGGTSVTEAYDYSGDTYKYFKEVHERNSINGRGLKLDSTVHYGENYNNAFWNGEQMVYGDGDGELFQRFTKCIDVIGH